MLLAGDMTVNPGIWVRQILAKGAPTFGKYVNMGLEKWSLQHMLDVWSEVTGKKALYVQCSIDDFTAMFGPAGNEYALQLQYGERCDPWEVNDDFIGEKELELDLNEVIGFRGVMEKLKHLA